MNLKDKSELEIQVSQQNRDFEIEIVKVIEIVQRDKCGISRIDMTEFLKMPTC